MATAAKKTAAKKGASRRAATKQASKRAAATASSANVDAAKEFLRPIPSDRVSVLPANPAVNKAGVEGPELIVAP